MKGIPQQAGPAGKRAKKSRQLAVDLGDANQPPQGDGTTPALQSESVGEPLIGEFIGKDDQPLDGGLQAQTSFSQIESEEDDAVVRRVEHLNRDVGWALISAGVVGLVMPGVIGAPFFIMGGLVLWPGNHKRVERWRQGHSPKMFHGAMKQINRFLDDLDKRHPRIGKQAG